MTRRKRRNFPSTTTENGDFRGERENQMRDGIMSVLQTLYHALRTWYLSGRIERLDFRGERENQMRDGIMSVSRHYTTYCLIREYFSYRNPYA